MPSHKFDIASVNEALDIRAVADHFGAAFRASGHTLQACCVLPHHNERTPSFTIYPDTNHFYCFGCQNGGDPLRLIALAMDWTAKSDFYRVIEYGADLAGISEAHNPADRDAARARNAQKRQQQIARSAELERVKIEKAFATWCRLKPITIGDVAYNYLRHRRGVDLAQLPHWPSAIRLHPEFSWNFSPDPDRADWQKLPAIITAMTRGAKVTAIHVTGLLASGDDVRRDMAQKGRIVIGRPAGASMRLSRGASGLSPKDAFDRHGMEDTLALCEGLEDGLSIIQLKPNWRVWAAYSLDNIGNIAPPECASDIVLCAENDASKGAKEALSRSIKKQKKTLCGRDMRVVYPPAGLKDWNEIDEQHG